MKVPKAECLKNAPNCSELLPNVPRIAPNCFRMSSPNVPENLLACPATTADVTSLAGPYKCVLAVVLWSRLLVSPDQLRTGRATDVHHRVKAKGESYMHPMGPRKLPVTLPRLLKDGSQTSDWALVG